MCACYYVFVVVKWVTFNFRKKADKKSGRKRPRLGDLTFTAAPDAKTEPPENYYVRHDGQESTLGVASHNTDVTR